MKRTGSKQQSNLYDANWDSEMNNQAKEHLKHEMRGNKRTSPFINLPYRFVLRPAADKKDEKLYQEAFKDTNLVLDWKFVEFVLVPLEYLSSCPICLDTPVIPRMTNCGHLFCYECILAYMLCPHSNDEELNATNEKKKLVGKCPVCNNVVTERELKPIYMETLLLKNPSVGQFTLMARENSTSNIILPANYCTSMAVIDSFQPFEGVYGGFMRYTLLRDNAIEWWCEYLQQELAYFEREPIKALVQETAIRQLKAKIARVSSDPMNITDGEVTVNSCLSMDEFKTHKQLSNSPSLQSENSPPSCLPVLSKELSFKNVQNPKSFFYFYQKIDFSNGYSLCLLDPLCIKILKSQFGSYQNFPTNLPPDIPLIDRKNCVIEGDLFYKKFKYLSHLPFGTIISFCTVDLSSIVSQSTWQAFQPEIQAIIQTKHQKNWAEDLRATSILDDHRQMVRLISRSFERTSLTTNSSACSLPPGTRFDDDAHFPAPSQEQSTVVGRSKPEKNAWETTLFVKKKIEIEEFPALE